LTPAALKVQKSDASSGSTIPHSQVSRPETTKVGNADLRRGQERLTQESVAATRGTASTIDAARRQAAKVNSLIASDPQAAVRAHSRLTGNSFEAAMANPMT
jgi:hypothetical protein